MKPAQLLRQAENVRVPFTALPANAALRDHLRELEFQSIQKAREQGATWEQIARTMGITRQALYQRLRARERRLGKAAKA